jgi:hypothetical protein
LKRSVRPCCIAAAAAVAAAAALVRPDPAATQDAGNKYVYSVAPYLWLPSINGRLQYGVPSGGGGRPQVQIGPNDYLVDLNFGFMINGEVRKGRWSLYTDFVYVSVGTEASAVASVNFGGTTIGSSLNAGTETSLTGEVWTLVAGYEVVQDPRFKLNSFAGFRYFGLQTETNWRLNAAVAGPGGGAALAQTGSVSKDETLVDGIYGIRGRIPLGQGGWSIPYYADVGTGSSDLTWQALLGIGYRLSWAELILAYRHLHYSQGDDKFIQELNFSGPQFGAIFRF